MKRKPFDGGNLLRFGFQLFSTNHQQQKGTTPMNFIQKIEAWVGGAVTTVENALSAEEKKVVAIAKPILASAEATALLDLKNVAVGFLTGLGQATAAGSSLKALEQGIVSAAEAAGSDILATAKSMEGPALQGLVGLLLSQLKAVA